MKNQESILIHNNDTWRSRVLRASFWALSGHVAAQFLRLASNLILTRLLVPEMFGLVALANVVLVGLHLISDLGLNQGLIQSRRGHEPVYLNTVWCVQIARNVMIWIIGLVFACSLYLLGQRQLLPNGTVYADPMLPYVLGALAFNSLIGGFTSTKVASASRYLALKRITILELGISVFCLAFMVGWAYLDRSIWALVVGSLARSVLWVVISHTALPGERNRFRFDREAFGEIFGFGKWVFLSSIVGFLALNADRLILGGLTDSRTLGLYGIAFFMVGALGDAFNKLFVSVALPSLSEVVRERSHDLKRIYYRFRLPLDATSFLATGLLFSAGHLLIRFLYDDRYLEAGHMIQILSICLFSARSGLDAQCFNALGKPQFQILGMLARLISLAILLPLSYRWFGLDGALWVIGCSTLLSLPFDFYFRLKAGIFDARRELIVLPLIVIGYVSGLVIEQFAMHWTLGK